MACTKPTGVEMHEDRMAMIFSSGHTAAPAVPSQVSNHAFIARPNSVYTDTEVRITDDIDDAGRIALST